MKNYKYWMFWSFIIMAVGLASAEESPQTGRQGPARLVGDLGLTGNAKRPAGLAEYEREFRTRRERMLDFLTAPEMLNGGIDSIHYSYRCRWQYYNACLSKGVKLDKANRYFAESDEIVSGEWQVLLFLRTYFAFKDTQLTPAARQRLADVLRDYKKNAPRSKSIEAFGTNGNHSIVNFSMYLLTDQEFGPGAKHRVVRDKFVEWVRYQGRFGRDEVNSPHYLERSLLPLLNMYDFSKDAELKLWAQIAIDQLLAELAVMSLDNVRGGPWCRAHQNHSPGVAEINDGRQDSLYVAGYLLFGHSPFPEYLFTDQILGYGFLTTTSYWPPAAVVDLADRETRGTFELRSHSRSVVSKPSPGPIDWSMYYYITPRYSLGSLQNRVELDNHVTGRLTRDFKNTQVWELTFSDPLKILGPKRELRISTGERKQFVEEHNANTANMQYKNVLFYKGQFMDYNHNLAAGGGDYRTEEAGGRNFHFWRVATSDGSVYVAAIDYPAAGGGILEVGTEATHRSCEAFRQDVRDNPSRCRDTGLMTNYTSCAGEQIIYDHGKATVNGKPWPLDGYPLYESPFLNSRHGSGLIEITEGNRSLRLDFREQAPRRESSSGDDPS